MVLLMPEKEGLQTAIDFTKYLLTLAGGAIAFGIQPTFFAGSHWLKGISIAALVVLMVSIVSGLMVFSRGCVMLSERRYKLDDPRIRKWGLINLGTFVLSFLLLAIAVAVKIIEA